MKIAHKALRQLLSRHPHWHPSLTGGGHVKLSSADGIVYVARTPSDWRGLKNLRARLRRLERTARNTDAP